MKRRSALLGLGAAALEARRSVAQNLSPPFTQIDGGTIGQATVPALSHYHGFNSCPMQARAAGFTKLAFFDDFTNSSTVTGNGGFASYQPGINWYPGQGKTLTSPTNYQVLTSTLASGISNGNTGGGSNASPKGGILQITGISTITNQGTLQSTPSALGQTPGSTGGFGPTGYYEGYMQFPSNDAAHMAMWTLPLALATSALTELDILEANVGGLQANLAIGSLNQWSANFGSDLHTDVTNSTTAKDANWHTYGMLISTPVAGVGTLTVYLDNVPIGNFTVGSGTNYPTVYTDPSGSVTRYLILGKDNDASVVNFDWVRYWGP